MKWWQLPSINIDSTPLIAKCAGSYLFIVGGWLVCKVLHPLLISRSNTHKFLVCSGSYLFIVWGWLVKSCIDFMVKLIANSTVELRIRCYVRAYVLTTTSSTLLDKHYDVIRFSHHCTSGESSSHMTSSEFTDQDCPSEYHNNLKTRHHHPITYLIT